LIYFTERESNRAKLEIATRKRSGEQSQRLADLSRSGRRRRRFPYPALIYFTERESNRAVLVRRVRSTELHKGRAGEPVDRSIER